MALSLNSVNKAARFFGAKTSLHYNLRSGYLLKSFVQKIFTSTILNEKPTSSVSDKVQKIYELRTYVIKPKAFVDFMKLTNEHYHLRTAKSKLSGYWISDICGLNEVTQIWEYDNYTHRAETRKALSEDEEWQSKYLRPALKMMVKQDNIVMKAVPWWDVKPPISTGGVYEMCVYDIKLGKAREWAHRLIQGFPERCELSEPVGIWITEIGPVDRAILLWPYQNLDEWVRIRQEAQQIEEWTEAVRDCIQLETKALRRILIPTEFSPWK